MTRILATIITSAALAGSALAADPIRVGLVDEVTGPQAEAGVLTMHGVRLAIDEINAAAEALESLSKPFAERRMDRGIREALSGMAVNDLESRVGE